MDEKEKIQKERRLQLITALESGDYSICTHALMEDKPNKTLCFCVTGVACDLSGIGKWEWFEAYDGANRFKYVVDLVHLPFGPTLGFSDAGSMPQPVAEYYGFRTASGAFSAGSLPERLKGIIEKIQLPIQKDLVELEEFSLVWLNDMGVDFATLAEFVRAEPVGMFNKYEVGS